MHLLSSSTLHPLIDALNPEFSPPKLVLSSLRTLNTMLDTHVSASGLLNQTVAISSVLYTDAGLANLQKILTQTGADKVTQDQITLAASLIAKSCGEVHYSAATDDHHKAQQAALHQKLLVGAGVLDALSIRLGSFVLCEYRRNSTDNKVPPKASPNAKLAPILDAIGTIICGSKLHSIEFAFSPTLLAVFPCKSVEPRSSSGAEQATTTMSTHLPESKLTSNLTQPSQQIITPAAFPPLSAAATSVPNHYHPPSELFPSLSNPPSTSNHYHSPPESFHPIHYYTHAHATTASEFLQNTNASLPDDSESSTGGDTPSHRKANVNDEVRPRFVYSDSVNTESTLDIEESDLFNWLISLVRSGDSITRLAAASVLTNLFHNGLVPESLTSPIGMLVVPILVRLMDEKGKSPGSGDVSTCSINVQTWNRWQVEERAPAVLAKLVVENQDLQSAAIDAGAVLKLHMTLKRASELPNSTASGVNGDSAHQQTGEPHTRINPEYSHRMKVKEGSLRCLAHLGLFKDDYRKAIIEAGVVQTIVSKCLKPLVTIPASSSLSPDQSNNEENPSSVLVAACGVVRSLSRSVCILRTSLIDAGVAIPIFNLLRHENIDVRNAAAAGICNLVLDFSPMRKMILDAGALDVLSSLAKSDNVQLRLNALWAIKHLVLGADVNFKRRSFENLGAEYIMNIISTIISDHAVDAEGDEEMGDDVRSIDLVERDPRKNMRNKGDAYSISSELRFSHLPTKARRAVQILQKQERSIRAKQSRKETISLQEQALELLRNLLSGHEIGPMIDLVLAPAGIGTDRLLSLFENILSLPTQPGEIVNAVVYILVHLAAGAPRHRQKIIERTDLLKALLDLCDYKVASVRTGLAWIVINLTWAEDGDEAEGVVKRINVLKTLGYIEKLREMRKDSELDVRERVKTAEYQMRLGIASTISGGVGSGGSGGSEHNVPGNGHSNDRPGFPFLGIGHISDR
jgi:hypothetical protein